jgi:hypothetical protein
MSIVFLKFSLNIVKSLVAYAYYSQFELGEEVHQMMDGYSKILMTKIHPDEIGMNASLTHSPVTGWVTYLDGFDTQVRFGVAVALDVPSDLLGRGG